MENKVNENTLREMYCNEKLSIREIARKLGASRGQIEYLMEIYGIEGRSTSEAKKITDIKNKEVKVNDTAELIKQRIGKQEIRTEFPPIVRKNMLIPIPLSNKAKEAVLTLSISDLHLGDACHLPETYWSTIANTIEVIRNIAGLYKITKFNIVLNGDISNGVDVYRYQELRNLVQRGHWQVFLTEMILKDTFKRFEEITEVSNVVLVRGTHDTLSNNLVIYLKRMLPQDKTTYLSHGAAYNIGTDKEPYHVLFMHGYGGGGSSPVPYKLFNDVATIMDTYRRQGVNVERVCSAHCHWLSSGFIVNNIYWDTTGGYQKWEYTINQRPCGFILYLYSAGEAVSIPIRPDLDVEAKEKSIANLEYKNFAYYGNYLLKHLEEIEKVEC
jgi:hypothetical protein